MELFITRHGETIGNVQRTIQGQQGGQLTELGFEQAYKLGERLKEYNFNAIISSDLNRCQQTLAPIAVHHQYLTPVLDPRIREKGAGEVEGQPLGTTDRMAKSLDISPREFRPIGGECWLDVNQRAKIFLKDMCDQYMNDEHMNKILVISHGGWIMEFLNTIRELKGEEAVYANKSNNTALYIIRFIKQNDSIIPEVLLDNDISHLLTN